MNFVGRLPAILLLGSAVALVQFQKAVALSSQEIREIARQFTVMIGGPDGLGSGVIIDKKGDTYTVLTAYHVIRNPGAYEIQTVDGNKYELLQSQPLPGVDLAMFEFKSQKEYRVAQMGSSNQPEGATIYIAGYPRPDQPGQPRVYDFVAALVGDPDPEAPDGYRLRYRGQAFKGMSGGPVLDDEARLIGINGQASVRTVEIEREVIETLATKGVPIETFERLRDRVQTVANQAPPSSPAPVPRVEPAPTPTPTPVAQVESTPSPEPEILPPSPEPSPSVTQLSDTSIAGRPQLTSPIHIAIDSMLRGQRTIFTRNGYFNNNPNNVAKIFNVQLPSEYNYSIRTTTRAAYHYAIPRTPDLKALVGAVFLTEDATKENPKTVLILCEATTPNNIRPADPRYVVGAVSCGAGTELLGTQ